MTKFNDVLSACLKMRLMPSLISHWPDQDAAVRYWHTESVPLVASMHLQTLALSLSSEQHPSPTLALLYGLYEAVGINQPKEGDRFSDALTRWKHIFSKTRKPAVLMLFGVDAWAGKHWTHDVAAFRAMKQEIEKGISSLSSRAQIKKRHDRFSDNTTNRSINTVTW